MGQKTRLQLITTGLKKAGRPDLAADAVDWLNSWLQKSYLAWPWPFLSRHAAGIPLSSGVGAVSVGDGNGQVGQKIAVIQDPIYVYRDDLTVSQKARLQRAKDGPVQWALEPTNLLPAALPSFLGLPAVQGVPVMFRARQAAQGQWVLIPFPVPDRDVLLAFEYLYLPEALAADGDVPIYPVDETLELVVEAHALQQSNRKDEANALFDLVATRVINDRVALGSDTGYNDSVPLDPRVFR